MITYCGKGMIKACLYTMQSCSVQDPKHDLDWEINLTDQWIGNNVKAYVGLEGGPCTTHFANP